MGRKEPIRKNVESRRQMNCFVHVAREQSRPNRGGDTDGEEAGLSNKALFDIKRDLIEGRMDLRRFGDDQVLFGTDLELFPFQQQKHLVSDTVSLGLGLLIGGFTDGC